MSCDPGDFICEINLCSGGIGAGDALFNYWNTHNCPAAYGQAINTNLASGTLEYNPAGQELVQDKVVELFNTYFETNTLTDDVTSTSFNPFQNELLNLCIDPTLPGVCGKFLDGYCSQSTREQTINSPTLTNFCGCYVPPDPEYLQYTLGSTGCQVGTGCTAGCEAGSPGCTGQPACDPLCHRALTSQKAYDPTGALITCPQTVCVIDDATVSATSSRVANGINFNNICSGCIGPSGGDGCLCVISGTNISSTMATIGIGTNYNQFCGPSSVCIVEDDQGNIISATGCTGINPVNIGVSPVDYLPNIGIMFILFLLVLIIFFIAITARSSSPTVEYTIYS